jgi:DNA-binding beta-propeller fold protein YncE
MSLKHLGYIDLPDHVGHGGFDHAAVDRERGLLYVAHTANDALDVIDVRSGKYVRSVAELTGVAGALVDESQRIVFTSNRGEDTVGIFAADEEVTLAKIKVGARPNGLAYDPDRRVLLCANVGNPASSSPPGVTLVDVPEKAVLATVPMPGRTRWTVYDPEQHLFFVNVADPPVIAVLDARQPDRIARQISVPARGPHGLDLDRSRGKLYCACDQGTLVALDSRTGAVIARLELSGPPDVIFLDSRRSHLYVAVGDPGVIDIVDVRGWVKIGTVTTEEGAHTIALDEGQHRVYAFLPRTHRAMVLVGDAG